MSGAVVRVGVLLIAVTLALFSWAQIIRRPRGDFPFHYSFARHYWNGDALYGSGRPIPSLQRRVDEHADNVPYPPFWAVAHLPTLLLPMHAAQIAVYPIGLIGGLALIGVMVSLTRGPPTGTPSGRDMAHELWRSLACVLHDRTMFWAVALGLLLSSRFLLRDLSECWVNTTLVALSWAGVYLWSRGRDALGGVSLGLAIALKLTAALFVPYFLLKRQWKMAGVATLTAVALTLLPMLRFGPTGAIEQLRTWTGDVIAGATEPDPSRGILGEESYNNLALRPSLARYLMRLPDEHIGRVKSPYYVEVLDLHPHDAGKVVRIVTIAMVVTGAWLLRRRASDRGHPSIAWECAAVSLAMLLLSPITWQHHAVGVFPAAFLISWSVVRRRGIPAWVKWALGVYIVSTLILNRALLGRDWAILLLSYHIMTAGLVALLVVVLAMARRDAGTRPAAA